MSLPASGAARQRTSFHQRVRFAVRAGLVLAGLTLVGVAWEGGRPVRTEQPYSVQLHLHGSFSEGRASIDSHAWEASELGVDVLWWSDHDFRITSHQAVSRYDFEAKRQPVDRGEPWRLRWDQGTRNKGYRVVEKLPDSDVELVQRPRRRGQRSLRVRTRTTGSDFTPLRVEFTSEGTIHQRPLAARPTLALSVFPVALGPDVQPFVEVQLSEHAPSGGLGIVQYALRYELTDDTTAVPVTDGAVRRVPVFARAEEWLDLERDLVADAAAGFDAFEAEDNALWSLEFGVATRNGARGECCFDELAIRTEVAPEEMYARQRALIAEVGERYPDLVQLQGVEISYGSNHLNEFSVGTELLDFDGILESVDVDGFPGERKFERMIDRAAVRGAHARDGLVSFNHMFGTKQAGREGRVNRGRTLQQLLATRALGADLLEVGYRDRAGADIEDFLFVWDGLTSAGLRLVGTGVSDSHGSGIGRWRGTPNNFVSWVLAAEPTKPALIDGLRRGRVFFGDIEHFDGLLDLRTAGGARMGDEVFTDRETFAVTVVLEGVRAPARLRVRHDREVVLRSEVPPGASEHTFEVTLAPGSSGVRAELHQEGLDGIVYSNPIWFLVGAQEAAARPERTRVDVAGLRSIESTGLPGLALTDVEATDTGVVLTGSAAPAGAAVFDLSAFGAVEAVRFDGLSGDHRVEGERLVLSDLTGTGRIVIERGKRAE